MSPNRTRRKRARPANPIQDAETKDPDDISRLQDAVSHLADWLIEIHAPQDIRSAFSTVMEINAAQITDRHIASFLRTVAASCRTPLLRR